VGLQSAKLIRAAVATLAFVLLLGAVYLLHAWFLPVDVVLYSAVADAVVAAALATGLLWSLRWFQPLGAFEKHQLSAIWLLLGYAFAISVPALIDRSLSFYILEKLEQRGGGIRQDAMAGIFIDEYMREHRLVDVRLTEQLASGTIVIEAGCVLLTAKGARLAGFSRAVRKYLLPRHRLLMGRYSGELTDIYGDEKVKPAYACQAAGPAQVEAP
jgi:hypothetical protein